MRKVFTTGQVAKVCKVAPRTVSKWFDSGRLRGYRIPGSEDRRIPREHLIKFLREHGMPLGELDGASHTILLIGLDPVLAERVQERLPVSGDCPCICASDPFEAGLKAQEFHADILVIDLAIGRKEAMTMAEQMRKNVFFKRALLLALANEDEVMERALLESGFDEVFRKPFDPLPLAFLVGKWIKEQDEEE